MSSKNNKYTNLLNYYGFDGGVSLETYPEERRNWRKSFKEHTDDAMGITDEQIALGENLTKRLNEAHEDINNHVTSEVTNAQESIENNIELAQESIEDAIDDAKESIESKISSAKQSIESNISSAKQSIESKISEVKSDTNSILAWTRTHWWTGN